MQKTQTSQQMRGGLREQAMGSVQMEFVRVREVDHNIMCLVSSTDPVCREYRAILEVTSTISRSRLKMSRKRSSMDITPFSKRLPSLFRSLCAVSGSTLVSTYRA